MESSQRARNVLLGSAFPCLVQQQELLPGWAGGSMGRQGTAGNQESTEILLHYYYYYLHPRYSSSFSSGGNSGRSCFRDCGHCPIFKVGIFFPLLVGPVLFYISSLRRLHTHVFISFKFPQRLWLCGVLSPSLSLSLSGAWDRAFQGNGDRRRQQVGPSARLELEPVIQTGKSFHVDSWQGCESTTQESISQT